MDDIAVFAKTMGFLLLAAALVVGLDRWGNYRSRRAFDRLLERLEEERALRAARHTHDWGPP